MKKLDPYVYIECKNVCFLKMSVKYSFIVVLLNLYI